MNEYIYTFLKNFDFSYIFEAGLMYVNDEFTKQAILKYIMSDVVNSELIYDIPEYPEIEEFIPELVEQSKIYKFQKYNDCPLFIHVY